jgi:hypothetical protein
LTLPGLFSKVGNDVIADSHTDIYDFQVFSSRMNTIGKHAEADSVLPVNPDVGSGKSGMQNRFITYKISG